MANDFSKASFVAARRLYFEQIAANTNSPIDSRRNNERLKRNAFSDTNISEDNTSIPYHSPIHKSTSHSNLISNKNELRSKLINSNSKIPIPGNHSPLIKSINVDNDEDITLSKPSSELTMEKASTSKSSYQNPYDNNYITYLKEMANPSNKNLSDKSQSSIKIINNIDEIPATPPIRPAKVSSPLLKNSKSSPLLVTNSKLPIPTSLKSSQEKDNNEMNEDQNEDLIDNKENKGWFSFTKEKAPGWFAMAKEKVSNANSWLSITRTKSEQIEEHKQWLELANSDDQKTDQKINNLNDTKENEIINNEIDENNLKEKENKDVKEIPEKNNIKPESDNQVKSRIKISNQNQSLLKSPSQGKKQIEIQSSTQQPAENEKHSKIKSNIQSPLQKPIQVKEQSKPTIQSPLQKPIQVKEQSKPTIQSPLQKPIQVQEQSKVQLPVQSPLQKPIQVKEQSKSTTQSPLQKPIQVKEQTKPTIQSPLQKPIQDKEQSKPTTQSPLQKPIQDKEQSKPTTQSPLQKPIKTELQTNIQPETQSQLQSSSNIVTEIQNKVQSPSQSPVLIRTQTYNQSISPPQSPIQSPSLVKIVNPIEHVIDSTKNKNEKPMKISSTTNEEIIKSPSTKPLNKIFNNTQNFIYKNSNLSLSNQSLNSNASTTTTEKIDDTNSSLTGDELYIDDKDLASSTIAFDKKVLQKIDNSIPQERNDSEVMNKIQRKKRTSFGSSSLSKTIDDDDSTNNKSYKTNIIEEENVKPKIESMRENPMYKYLRNKNEITYQNFNTVKNKYEDDSDASSYYEDSDGYISGDNDNRKESFESKLKKKSKYFIKGRKLSFGEKKSNTPAVVSKKIKPSLPVPVLPVRKSSTSNLTAKIKQDSIPTPAAKEKLMYKEKPVNPSQMASNMSSPPTRSVSTSSNNSAQVHTTSPLTMYSRVNESLDVENKPKNYKVVKTEPIMIDSKPERPERFLKYKPPRRTSSSLNRTSKHTRNKPSQDYSINEHSSIFIDAPPERGRSIFKESREFSNKSHSIDTELSRRGNGRESRNRSPDYRLKSEVSERGRGRTRKSVLHEIDDDDDVPLMYSKNINTRKYLKKYLDRREGQRSQSLDASKSKSHRRNDSDDYFKIGDETNEDTMYITELLNTNFLDQDNGKENIFYTNKLTPRTSSLRQDKYSSTISSASSISSLSSTSSSASSMTNNTSELSKNPSVNNKTLINDAPIDSYYRVSGVIKHSVVPIGSPSILYGDDSSYNSLRSKNTLYNSRSSITLNRYSYQKSNKNNSQKRISSTSSNNDDETSLIFGNLPEEIYNFLKPELEVPAPTRTSSRESVQSLNDSKRHSLSSLHQSLTLNDDSDNDEATLKSNSARLQAAVIKEEVAAPKTLTNAQKRIQKITSEILSTERTYVKELHNLINIYIEPLKKNHLLEQEEFNSVFANIEDIYKFHSKSFLPPLENVCNNENAKISKFFLDISGSFENFYSKYYYAFNGANTLLSLVASNNHNVRIPNLSSSSYIINLPLFDRSNKKRLKKFKNFLKNCTARPDHTQLSLQGYLILPVQRLPRYLLLLEQLVKYSKDDPIEKEENEKAAELMKKVVESCNSYMKQCEEKHILLEITTKHIRLDSNDSRGEMVDKYIKIQGLIRVPGAKLIRKGDLQILRSVTSNASIFPSKRLSSEYVGRNPNLINPTVRCSSALSMATTTTNSSSRTYHEQKNNPSRLSSSNESIHSVSTNNTYVQPPTATVMDVSSNFKRNSTSVIDMKKNQTTDSIGMFYLIHNLFIYCKLDGILVNVLDLEECSEEPASFSSTSSEFVEIESKKTDIVLIVSDSKTQLYLTSPDINSVYSWHQTINKQWRSLKKIEK